MQTESCITKDYISFYVKGNQSKLAIGELTQIQDTSYLDAISIEIPPGKLFYFSRLLKPKGFQPANAAVVIMASIAKWADKERIFILDEINSYGELSLSQLVRFNAFWGFRMIPGTLNVMIRKPKN